MPYLDTVYSVFLVGGVAIMLAGSNEVLQPIIGPWGRYVTGALILVVLLPGMTGVINVSARILPLLFILMLTVSLWAIRAFGIQLPTYQHTEGYGTGVLYASYNLGFALAVFAGLGKLLTNRKDALIGGVVGGLILGVLVLLQVVALWGATPPIRSATLPMLAMAYQWHPWAGAAYIGAIWIAMYTTALTNSLALSLRLTSWVKLSWPLCCVAVMACCLLFSYVGFVSLMKTIYPIFGYVGLYLLYRLLRTWAEG